MDSVNFLNFYRGLIISAQGIQLSDSTTYDLKPQQKNDYVKNTSFNAKLMNSTTKKESFLLKNHIEISANDLKHVSQIFDTDKNINSAMALLADESSTNVFLIIQCEKVELIIKKESIKPSDKLTDEVKEALKHYDPYHKLMDVFNNYGYFLPKKMILGHKIYRMTYLTMGKDSTEPNDKNNDLKWTTLDDFSESKFKDILSQWEKYMSSYNFDLSYLVSINGEFIKKDEIEAWIENCLKSNFNSLQVIGCKELYPLYEIFDLSLRQEVENILGINSQFESIISNQSVSINIKERVLMAGVVPIKNQSNSYNVKFRNCFKSNNYQVFGKFITQDDEPIDDVIIKFDFMDTYGFLIFIEDYDFTYKNPRITWMLIGIPAEVGYFSPDTRKINVLGSGHKPFVLKSNNSNIVLKVPENLPQDSVIIVSFKYPPSHYEPSFIAKIKSYQDNKILFNIHCPDYESPNSDDSKSFDDEVNIDSRSNDVEEVNVNVNEDSDFIIDEYDEDSDSNDINNLTMDNFQYGKSNYNKRASKRSQIKAPEYSVQWFILRNFSDITDSSETMIYLNKIGFHLIKPSQTQGVWTTLNMNYRKEFFDLPDECILKIFTYLNDVKDLYNCLFINKFIHGIAVYMLWKNPFINNARWRDSIILTYLNELNIEEQKTLILLRINFPFIKSHSTKYAPCLETLDLHFLHIACLKWLAGTGYFCQCGELRIVQAVVSAIVRMVLRTNRNLKILNIKVAEDEPDVSKAFIFSLSKPSISSLHSFHLTLNNTPTKKNVSQFLARLPDLCLSLCDVTFDFAETDIDEKVTMLLIKLIRVQKALDHFTLKCRGAIAGKYIEALESQKNHLMSLHLDRLDFRKISDDSLK
ncbi:7593_t:CDS:2, partial [Cetraspora pellucida]